MSHAFSAEEQLTVLAVIDRRFLVDNSVTTNVVDQTLAVDAATAPWSAPR